MTGTQKACPGQTCVTGCAAVPADQLGEGRVKCALLQSVHTTLDWPGAASVRHDCTFASCQACGTDMYQPLAPTQRSDAAQLTCQYGRLTNNLQSVRALFEH